MNSGQLTCGVAAADCPGFRQIYPEVEVCLGCGLGRTIPATISIKDQDYLDPAEVGGTLRPEYFQALYRRYIAGRVPGQALKPVALYVVLEEL
jgi:hypothetical protein